jgi:MFS family permease
MPEPSLLRDPAYRAALAVAVVVALGFGLVIPVLPLFARSFGVGLFAVTAVVSTFAGVRLVSNLYTGALSDRIGTRRAVGWGALIVAASSLLVATAGTYWQLLAYRAVGGFGSALFFNALLTHVVGIVPAGQRGRAVGGLQGAFLFGIVIGPGVGGFLAEPLGLRGPFAVYAVFCAAAGFVGLRFLPRDERGDVEDGVANESRPRGVRQLLRVARDLCTDSTFAIALVLMAASRWAATGVRFSLVPVFGTEVSGASVLATSLALVVAAGAQLAVTWPAGKLADSLGRRWLSVGAYLFFAAVALGLSFADTVTLLFVVMTLYGVASGLTAVTPPAIIGDIVPPQRTGVSIGVLNTAGDLGSVLGPLVSGVLAQAVGYRAGFGASAVLLAVAGLLALRMRETLPAQGTGGSGRTGRHGG